MPNPTYIYEARHIQTAGERGQAAVLFEGVPAQAQMVLAWVIPLEGPEAGKALQLRDGDTTIGRNPSKVNILLQNPTVSGIHARISRRVNRFGEPYYVLCDLGSSNGTWIDREEVFERVLQDGTTVEFGNMKVAFKCL